MLAEMQRAVGYVFVWSDEKIFTMETVTNGQNDMHVMQEICLKVVVTIYAA